MRYLKLIQHMKRNADVMSEGLLHKIRNSNRCDELLQKVPWDEHKRYALQMYRDLTDWLGAETDSIVEQHYTAVGMQRAQQGVPFSNTFWAVCIARDYLWEYIQEQCLFEEPIEVWGAFNLLHSLNQFFDRSLYFVVVGYQTTTKDTLNPAHAVFG